jgi:hypothetical protein
VTVDTGDPVSYLTCAPGTPVYAADEIAIGKVKHVLADEREDVFDGIVVETDDGDRFADADQVDRIYERAVVLKLSAEAARSLPAPTPNPAVVEVGADDFAKDSMRSDVRTERKAGKVWLSSVGDWFRGLRRRR